ncbi:MAG: tRNA(Met) cytidine acetyltransferase [Chromatiaceae bacterium]|nr:tRNA(Met) cytidine acetyltransferase [Chromatiaceae bacterium]
MHAVARARRHRQILLLAGRPAWCEASARALSTMLTDSTAVWLSEAETAPGRHPSRAAEQLLGGEVDLLILDAHGGFDPDGFGLACGALRGGGLLVLLTPPLAHWAERPDPQAARIAIWPYQPEQLSNRFIARLARLLDASPAVIKVREGAPLTPLTPPETVAPTCAPPLHTNPATPATADQQRAIAAILVTAGTRARQPLVISAHRGRGKSAALGLAAAELLASGQACCIVVTAPRRSAVGALYAHAQARLGEAARLDAEGLRWGQCQMPFRAPEVLLGAPEPHADLLLVDEAAAIPAPLLERLLRSHPRLVFASTVHGYEGTGRGFEIRFRAALDRLAPDWRALSLDTPIRWAAGDPLEALSFRALLLDAAPADAAAFAGFDDARIAYERLDRAALAEDEPRLRQLFGLLVLAHYQTRPMDLRMLLDGPGVRLYVARFGGAVAATLIATEEGGLEDAALRADIFAGRRRPRGHLLPQTLSAHGGLAEAPARRMLRVVRIATHPALTWRGLGRALLQRLEADARREGLDLVGASFGAAPELIAFWTRCGYAPAHLGTSRNAASGEPALVVLRALSPAGADLLALAERRLAEHLPVLLAGPLRTLAPESALAVLSALPPQPCPEPLTRQEWLGFAEASRPFESSLPALARLGRARLAPALSAARIRPEDGALWIAASLQFWSVAALVEHAGLSGRQTLIERLRAIARSLIPGD